MRQSGRGRIWIAAAVGVAACGEGEVGRVAASGAAVEMVGRGVVSSELPEFAAAFTPDGDTLFFNRTSADRSRIELLVSVRADGSWGEPTPFPPTRGIEAIDPFMTADGQRLYYSAWISEEGIGDVPADIWHVDRTGDGWSEAVALPDPINSDSSDVFNSVASDGTMVFSSRRDGERRVYETRRLANGWSQPVLLRFGDMTGVSNPAISPDGRFLVVSSRLGADGPPDLFVACRESDGWSELRPLPAPINGPFTEFAPAIFGQHLYFTSERPGIVPAVPDGERPPGDIYRAPIGMVASLCGPA